MTTMTTNLGFITTGPATRRLRPRSTPRRGSQVSQATYICRRVFVALLASVLVVTVAKAGGALGDAPLASSERTPPVGQIATSPAHTAVVRSGDSLWSIVSRLAPNKDPRPLVDDLSLARNGAPLIPGETISLDQ